MVGTSARTLQLLSLLQTHRYWPGDDLADRLEVSIRTLRRDVDRLRELGYPVQASRGVGGGYQLARGAALPPLVLDDEEAVALTVGLLATARTVGSSPGADDAGVDAAEASVRALAKVIPVLPARLRRRVEALRSMSEPVVFAGAVSVDPGTLTTVALACRDGERLRCDYVAADGGRTARHLEPLRLVPVGRRWYLVGWDLDRHDWRTFRLDRISRPEVTGERFAARRLPARDAMAFVRDRLRGPGTGQPVEAILHAPIERVDQRIARWATLEPIDAEHCRLRMTVDSLDWPAFALASSGVEFTVQSPAELAELVREWGRRLTRAGQRKQQRL